MMKKIVNIIKKIFSTISIFLFLTSQKIFATTAASTLSTLYGTQFTMEPDKPTWIELILKIARDSIIPIIILLVGLIIYFKKSKNSEKKKFVILGILIMMEIIYFIVYMN